MITSVESYNGTSLFISLPVAQNGIDTNESKHFYHFLVNETMAHTKEEEKQNKNCSFRESRKQKKQQQKDEECSNIFVEELHNAVWPNTNIEKLSQLLNVSNTDSLETKHGARKESLLHR